MKALKTLALALALLLALSACGVIRSDDGPTQVVGGSNPAEEPASETAPESPEEAPPEVSALRVGALKGPTAMGMVRMMSDDGVNRYTLAGSADELTPKLIKGELDIICVPANLAAVLYNKTEGQLVTLAVNTLGVLYIVENGGESVQSMADLKGKTIVAAGKGSTPEFGLRYLLEQNGLDPDQDMTVDWKSEHAECVAALAAGTADIALLPQPFVTVAQGKLEKLRVALDLTEEWDALDNGSAMITGVAVARRELVEERPELVEKFLIEYARSVEWVNENTAEAAELVAANGIIESPAVAEKALPHCNIVCLTGEEMREKLSGYLSVLAEANPESVGGRLPEDGFYYVP
ncbi:ABC transporter substrate-binding protein [uncultured Oscillibacter sp.]|jgi:NitT/TauT family transport system substrate-binding protein|uniref:ABC transporter substrate-binding protein n=1 Tax=uncultured Oscillibacter sp. TaxID=876091 RepID=UPI0025F5253B|nr:ABC transporter substrate-binding protein [uncultured Oscillibacter sp.]